jgi:thioredoxin reductase
MKNRSENDALLARKRLEDKARELQARLDSVELQWNRVVEELDAKGVVTDYTFEDVRA